MGCNCKKSKEKKVTQGGLEYIICDNCLEVISYKKVTEDELIERRLKEKIDKLKEIELNKAYNCSVFDLIPKIPDGFIRLCATDPPYGDDSGYGRNNKKILNNEDYLINIKFLNEIYPKMQDNSTIYLFSNHKFYEEIKKHAIKIGLKYVNLLILVKNNISMGNPFRNQYEVCLVFDKGNPDYYSKDFSNVIRMKHINHTDDSHPHTKDVDVLRKIIRHSSKKGDIVFDGFGGSFSTPKAAELEERKWLVSELSEDWFKKGIKEMKEIDSQTSVFTEDKEDKEEQLNLFQ